MRVYAPDVCQIPFGIALRCFEALLFRQVSLLLPNPLCGPSVYLVVPSGVTRRRVRTSLWQDWTSFDEIRDQARERHNTKTFDISDWTRSTPAQLQKMDEGSGQPVAGPSSGTARGTEAADTVMAEPTWQDDTPPPLDAPVRRRRKQGFARAQSGPVVPSLLSGNVFTALPPRATASSSQASQGGGSGASGSNGPLRRLGEYRNRNAWGPSRSHGDLRTVMPAPSSLLPASGNDADMAPIASGSTFMFGSESGAQASNEGRASRADGAKASPFKRSKSQQQSIPEGSGGTPRVGASSTSPGPWNRLAALFAQPTSPQLPRRTPSSDRIRPVGSQASSGFPLGPSWEALPPLGGDEGEMVFVRPNEAIPPPSPSDHLAARSKSKAKLKGKRRSGETGNEADDDNSGDSDGLRFSMEQDEACFVDSFPSPASSPFASLHASTLLSSPSASTSKIDFLAALPTEVALYTLLCVDDFATLLKCMEVSRTWYILARDNVVWRKMFARKEDEGWKIRPEALANQCPPDSTPPLTSSSTFATSRPLDAEGRQLSQSRSRPSLRASRSSSTRSAVADVAALAERSGSVGGRLGRKLSEILGELGGLTIAPLAGGGVVGTEHLPPASNGKLSLTPRTSRLTGEGVGDYAWLGHASDVAAGGLDWWKLYRDRWLLQQRWTYGVMEKEYLKGHTDGVYCIQFDNEKVITGSVRPTCSLVTQSFC